MPPSRTPATITEEASETEGTQLNGEGHIQQSDEDGDGDNNGDNDSNNDSHSYTFEIESLADKREDGQEDEGQDSDDEADMDMRNYNSPDLKWNLFRLSNRNKQWIMDTRAQCFFATRLYRFDNLRGPGVGSHVYRLRMKKKMSDTKDTLIKELLDHWEQPHKFEYLLGPNPSKEELKKANRKIRSKLNSLLTGRTKVTRHGPDIFKMLFERARQPSAKELWAHEEEATAGLLVLMQMIEDKWKPSMSHQKILPIQMTAHKKVFNRLPEEEKKKWYAKAEAWEAKPLTQKDMFLTLPKLFFAFGDALRKHLNWSVFIWAGGLTDTGAPASLREEWYDEDDTETQVLLGSKEYQAVDTVLNGLLARRQKDVQIMLPYHPRIPNAFIPIGVPLLKDMIEYDITMNKILTDPDTLVEALKTYLLDTYALVPMQDGKKRKGKHLIPPWDAMDRQKGALDEWVDHSRLPKNQGFRFSAPNCMAEEDCQLFAAYVCSGEYGKLPRDEVFQWRNQQKANIIQSMKIVPKKRKVKKIDDMSSIGIDIVSGQEQKRPKKNEAKVEVDKQNTEMKSSTMDKQAVILPTNTPTNCAPGEKKTTKASKSKGKGKRKPDADEEPGNVPKAKADTDQDNGDAPKRSYRWGNPRMRQSQSLSLSMCSHPRLRLCLRGQKGRNLMGMWFNDFHYREMNLEWESEGNSEANRGSLVDMVRFLEASEVEKAFKFSAFLDISAPDIVTQDQAADIFDRIFESDEPLPYPHQLIKLKDWKSFCRLLQLLIDAGLKAIVNYPCDKALSRLRIGGGLGVFGVLHALELLRRIASADELGERLGVFQHTLKEIVSSLLRRTRTVFEREMLWRWSSGSLNEDSNMETKRLVLLWHVLMEATLQQEISDEECFGNTLQSEPPIPIVQLTLVQARLCERSCEPNQQIANKAASAWRDPDVVRGMQVWSEKMTTKMFADSSVVEKFVWVYGLHMLGTSLDIQAQKWWKLCVNRTIGWMEKAINSLNPALFQRWKTKASRVKVLATEKTNIDADGITISNQNIPLSSDDAGMSDCVIVPRGSKAFTSPSKRSADMMDDENTSAPPPAKRLKPEPLTPVVSNGTNTDVKVPVKVSKKTEKVKKPEKPSLKVPARPPSTRLQARKQAGEAHKDPGKDVGTEIANVEVTK
ncbi:hypothetical protein M422DRAFT_248677 [Sphaerobolus stellatus SS14]|nr:hypothetical protein M422DRAFT_248677 [Sphaerobolus stellatus SS14]